MPDLTRAIDVLLVLIGGAGGVLIVWWLDGRRAARRERRDLIGAVELVCLELAANVASLRIWIDSGHPPPLDLRWEAWTSNQVELARGLPREITGHVGASFYLARMFARNAEAGRQRGSYTADDVAFARRVRDTQQASLTELQGHLRNKLGVRFAIEPVPPAEFKDPGDQRP